MGGLRCTVEQQKPRLQDVIGNLLPIGYDPPPCPLGLEGFLFAAVD